MHGLVRCALLASAPSPSVVLHVRCSAEDVQTSLSCQQDRHEPSAPLISRLPSSLRIHSAASAMTETRPMLPRPLSAHSQIVRCRQCAVSSSAVTFASRALLLAIFLDQNSILVPGRRNSAQSCPCQKHPWTNTTARKRGNTMSGRPGMPRACSR